MLRRLDDLVEIAERRGVKFPDLLTTRRLDPDHKGHLPSHRVTWQGGEAFAWSERQANEIVSKAGMRLDEAAPEGGGAPPGELAPVPGPVRPLATIRELHENRELERVFSELAALGLNIDDYALVQEEAVTGEKMPARFAWVMKNEPAKPAPEPEHDQDGEGSPESGPKKAVKNSRFVEAPNLSSVLGSLHEIGRRGMEIKRFKGLGEMDAEQLWVTTMDPSKRTLVRVNWDMASDADSLFTILMGEEVEPRRKFIEDHALEVKNLDV
jgi:DNA gyrase subunit B